MINDNLSIIAFINHFSDPSICYNYMEQVRWPSGIMLCPFCNSGNAYSLSRSYTYRCSNKICRNDFTVTSGTQLFSNLKLPIETLFYLVYQYCINAKSVSSIQTSKNISSTQKTSWSLSQKVRLLFEENHSLSGVVEIDEAFFSKKKSISPFKMWATSNSRKGPIIGMMQRGGKVIVKQVPDRSAATIELLILQYVQPESTIYTDGFLGYKNLDKYYNHHWIDHSGGEYGRGDIHTNSIEGFWSYLKKSLRSAHHSISEKHLQLYLDQVCFTYNNRNLTSMQRFNELLRRGLQVKCDVSGIKINTTMNNLIPTGTNG